MSTPAGGSGLRTAGFVLLGVSVVLLVAGVFSLRADDGSSSAAAARTATTAPAPTTPRAVTTTTAAPSPTGAATTTQAAPLTTQAAPPPTTQAPAPPITQAPAPPITQAAPPPTTQAPADPRSSIGVVVLNNSTISGLASRAAAAVRADGWTVREVGNLTGRTPTTTVYYPDGRGAAANALAAAVGAGTVQPRPGGLPGSDDTLVIVVTSDFGG